jgi:3-hydroxyacyl-[acyl-carrier-protein] dehydratase
MFVCNKGQRYSLDTFCFIDEVMEVKQNESLTAKYILKPRTEFLKDHFPGFPVMPGVLLLETLKQAALTLLEKSGDRKKDSFCLTKVENVKFGQFVRPGSQLTITVRLVGKTEVTRSFEGRIDLQDGNISGRALLACLTFAA